MTRGKRTILTLGIALLRFLLLLVLVANTKVLELLGDLLEERHDEWLRTKACEVGVGGIKGCEGKKKRGKVDERGGIKKERLGSVYIMAKGLRCEVQGVKSKDLFRCDPRSYRQSAEMLGSCRQCMDGGVKRRVSLSHYSKGKCLSEYEPLCENGTPAVRQGRE